MRDRAQTLRHTSPPAEQELWSILRNRQCGGYKFRRQAPVGIYVADFVCIPMKLIVELDGPSHDGTVRADLEREAYLKAHGFRILRFTNQQVHEELEGVFQMIFRACEGE